MASGKLLLTSWESETGKFCPKWWLLLGALWLARGSSLSLTLLLLLLRRRRRRRGGAGVSAGEEEGRAGEAGEGE